MNKAGVLRWSLGRLALVGVAFLAMLVTALPAAAATAQIFDESKVLNITQVQNEAARLPDPVSIYTTTKFASDPAAFDREAQSHLTGQNNAIVIAMNTQSHHLAIRTGSKSRISQSAAQSATDAFKSSFRSNNGDYTAATIASLNSLRNSAQQSRNGGVAMFNWIVWLVVLLLVVAIIGIVIAGIRRRRATREAPVYQQPGYGPPGYGPPGYGPPGYGPGYGPGYRQGMSPMAAGGIGAVAGGVLGYELGRMEGEREEYREGHRGDYNEGGGYDGGSYGGGGADADFGSGGDSGGGGGDF